MSEPFIPIQIPVLLPNGKMDPVWWKFFVDTAVGLTMVDLGTQVTGILDARNGGTSVDNDTKSLTLSGAFALTLTQTAATNVTLPTSGLLVATTSPLTAVNLTVSTGVTPDSGGIKHKRITTGVVAPGASSLVTVTWGTAFTDANYTVTASVLDATAAIASLQIVHIETITAAAVAVRVQNTAAGNLTGTLSVIALHD